MRYLKSIVSYMLAHLLLLIICCGPANAQTGGASISVNNNIQLIGTVMNASDLPVQQAVIQLNPGNLRVVADRAGQFRVSLKEGIAYQISIQALGYRFVDDRIYIQDQASSVIHKSWLLQDSVGNLTDVEVRALNQKQQLASTPIKAQILDLSTLQGQSASLIELLNRTAGVRIRTTGGLGASNQILLNGFQNKAVRFFKDGIPTDYLGAAFDLGSVPVNLLDHVEIYKGVVPVYLGADALGGAVNLVSKAPRRSFLNASYQFGSFNTHRATLNGIYYNPDGHFFAGLNAYMNYSDNNYGVDVPVTDSLTGATSQIHTKLFHSKFSSYYGEAFAGWKDLSWADLVKLSLTAFDIRKEFPFGSSMDKPFGKAKGRQHSLVGNLLYRKALLDHRLNWEQFFVASRLHSTTIDTISGHYDWYGHFTPNGSEQGELSTTGSLAKIHYDYLLSRTGLDFKLGHAHRLYANVIWNRFRRKGTDPRGYTFSDGGDVLKVPATYRKIIAAVALESTLIPGKLDNNLIGKFYQYTTDATDADYQGHAVHTNNSQSAWGVADGVKFTLSDHSFLNLSAETALRLPEQDELFGDGHLKLSNFGLQPERSFNVNLGYKLAIPRKWSLELNGFYRHTKNLILLMPINFIYAQSQNVDEVQGEGLDADLGVFLTPWLQATGNFTYQNLRLKNTGYNTTEGARLKNTPYFFANAGLHGHWRNVLKKKDHLRAYWLFNYVREYYLSYIPKSVEPGGFLGLFGRAGIDARNIIPDQQIHTIGVNYEPAQAPFSLGLEVKDIFDTRIFDQFRIQNPGRSFSVKINYSIH
ncbi:TonB-dependent receptor plug domain-containing protein [Arachidicoccus terrestris]|uniref:TonB-dependent receptor plug domain-containing protein n=1 Tax=Arachidicoccus terrestris TaxID=2875539 RepID=UPI001CC70124|nr:TonB-dependent receptor plug domain-containing protein [Arachidicoccus terrestris]UAY55401.1 TonB-dependent receptor plug domain-containing protein [Arachidicoccus terrestris]